MKAEARRVFLAALLCYGSKTLQLSFTGKKGKSVILDPSAYGFGNAPVSSGKLCAGVAKIWLFGPHSACS